jgi:hypothetical protein
VNRVTVADVCLCAMPEHPVALRPFARAHREAAAALFAAAHPERADEPAGWGAPSGPAGPRRYVAVTGTERIVGYGRPGARYEAGIATNGATVGWMVPPGGSRVMPKVSPLSTPEMSVGPLRPLCTARMPTDRILWPGAPISQSW